MKRIVDACYPESLDEAQELWHDIKPVKFGESQTWINSGSLPLATYQVPEDASYLLVLRTECYVTTFDETAPGFGQFSPPPSGTAQWLLTDITAGNAQYAISPRVAMHILCDSDEFIIAKGDHLLQLIAQTAQPDAVTRFIRTLVYAYLCGPKIAGKIGSGESTYFGITDE